MDFGRVSPKELRHVDFTLPKDPPLTRKVLSASAPNARVKVFVGCSKWGRKEWVGKIYPEKTKESQFFDEYVKHYNSIELNATHYRVNEEDIRKWNEKAGKKKFIFCPKVPQSISHFSSAFQKPGTMEKLDEFLAAVSLFGKHLGPVFLQLSDKFGPKNKEQLYAFLKTLPRDLQWFLEVRHKEWFLPEVQPAFFSELHKLKIGAVITDTAGRRDCCHMHVTTKSTFIRYVGNSLHESDYTRIDDWVKRIRKWLAGGLKELYFFMHMHDEALSPELSLYLAEELNRKCKLDVQLPVFSE